MRWALLAIVAVVIASCTSALAPTPTPTSTAASSLTARPSASRAAASATAPASFTPNFTQQVISDISDVFRPRVTTWRPPGTTLVVASTSASGATTTLIAVPVAAGSTATPLLDVIGAWDVSADGRWIVASVPTNAGPRLAKWDLRTGTGAWLGTADSGGFVAAPVLSRDSTTVYYGVIGAAPDFRGTVFAVGLDGTAKTEIARLDRFGGLSAMLPDGSGLVWSLLQAGGSAEILDLRSRTSRHLDDVATVASIRTRQPRILLSVGGCCAGYPGGGLALWDDVAMTFRGLAQRSADGVAWGTASWDPAGTRIVAVRYDNEHRYLGLLYFIDPVAGTIEPLAKSPETSSALWLDEGIVIVARDTLGTNGEVKMVQPADGSTTSLYKGVNLYQMKVVRP